MTKGFHPLASSLSTKKLSSFAIAYSVLVNEVCVIDIVYESYRKTIGLRKL